MNKIDEILVRAPNWIGDAVISLPAIENIQRCFPNSSLTILSKPWAIDVFKNKGYKLLIHDKANKHKGLKGFYKIINEIKSKKFNLAILLQNAFEAALISFLSSINKRVGYSIDGRGLLLTDALKIPSIYSQVHEVFYYLNIIKSLDIDKPKFIFPNIQSESLNESNYKNAEQTIKIIIKKLLSQDKLNLAIAPGAAFGSAKQWPIEDFAQSAYLLNEKIPLQVFIFGGLQERSTAELLGSYFKKFGIEYFDLTGKFTLADSISCLKNCNLLLSNDSGLMHIGAALKISTLAMYGPTNPLTTGPLGQKANFISELVPCSPCLKRECPLSERTCFKKIVPNMVVEKSLKILNLKRDFNKDKAVFFNLNDFLGQNNQFENKLEDLAFKTLSENNFKIIFLIANDSNNDTKIMETLKKYMVAVFQSHNLKIDHFYNFSTQLVNDNEQAKEFFKNIATNLDLDFSFWIIKNSKYLKFKQAFPGKMAFLPKNKEKILFSYPELSAPDLQSAAEWIVCHDD